MIIGRILYQGSKLALSKVASYSCLWEVCGVKEDKIDVDEHCYDAMDELFERQELIQKKIAKKHLKDGSVILYDITSSYFEGECETSEIAAFGYNRDKKWGKKQIVIGLVCTKDGCPVAVEVFRGNTNDGSTVQSIINDIKKKYGVSDFVFVGDRGMLTRKNIDDCTDTSTITALSHSAIKELCEEKNVQLSLFDEKITNEIILPEEPGVRYGLRRNPLRGQRDRNTRLNIIAKTEEKLAEIAVPKRKATDKQLAARATKVFVKYKSEKYFDWDISGGKIIFSRNTDKIAEEEKYDGLYVIRSEDISPETMTIQEIVESYKSLINVEQAFRNMKTVQLEIRPIYHKTDDRVKAHVFLCTLAYYLLWHMNKALETIYANNSDCSLDYVIEVMKSLQKSKLTVGDTVSYIIADPNEMQNNILYSTIGKAL
jgi:transposase